MNRIYSALLVFLAFPTLTGLVFAHGQGADFDASGKVDFADFLLFARGYGTTQERFDLTEDGQVNFQDFLAFATDFGKITHEAGETTVISSSTPSISTFRQIQENIFNQNCLSSSCHSTTGAAGGLSLEPDVAYQNLVNQLPVNQTALTSGLLRVFPGKPDQSFLIKKLTGSGLGLGDPMPRGFSSLSGVLIDAIRAWIEAGAPLDGTVENAPDLSQLSQEEQSHHFEPPAPPAQGIQLHLAPFAIDPGKEREIFSTTSLNISEDLLVNKIEIAQPEGSHHFILYRITNTPPPPGIRDLDPTNPFAALSLFSRRLIVGSQSSRAVFALPEGVAIRFPADAAYELNSHFVNISGENTLIGEVYINLHTVSADQVQHVARPIFVTNLGLSIPPGQTVTASMNWTLPQNIDLVLLSSHMHRHGKAFDIFLDNKRIYQNLAWDDPVTLLFNPSLKIQAGKKVRFECTHTNDDKDFTLHFGLTAENDEMCILLGYYY